MSFLCSKRRSMNSMKSACQYLAIHPTTYRGWGNSCNFMLNVIIIKPPIRYPVKKVLSVSDPAGIKKAARKKKPVSELLFSCCFFNYILYDRSMNHNCYSLQQSVKSCHPVSMEKILFFQHVNRILFLNRCNNYSPRRIK